MGGGVRKVFRGRKKGWEEVGPGVRKVRRGNKKGWEWVKKKVGGCKMLRTKERIAHITTSS